MHNHTPTFFVHTHNAWSPRALYPGLLAIFILFYLKNFLKNLSFAPCFWFVITPFRYDPSRTWSIKGENSHTILANNV